MIGSLLALSLLTAQAAPEQCSVIQRHPSGTGFTYQLAPGWSVTRATPPMTLPEGFTEAESIVCARQRLILTDNDFRVVLDLRIPIMIGGEGVMGSLEWVDGKFRFDVIRGELSPEQQEMVQAALDRGQKLAGERTE